MNRKKMFGLLAIVFLVCVAGTAHSEVGISDDEIRIGVWTPLSGPLALLGTSARDGVKVWADEVNEKGGIYGRKISVIVYDDGASLRRLRQRSGVWWSRTRCSC